MNEVAHGCQVILELGMGRGRCALQLFLHNATVLGLLFGRISVAQGVELCFERYGKALEQMERLAHRPRALFCSCFQGLSLILTS